MLNKMMSLILTFINAAQENCFSPAFGEENSVSSAGLVCGLRPHFPFLSVMMSYQ
jgi:hypothetical protein